MRKLFSIAFIILLLLNVMGYYGVFVGLKIRNDSAMAQRLNLEDFDKSQIVKLRIPLTVPYAVDDIDYERVDGKIQYNGEIYRLLKQRLSRDTLTIICVRDAEEKKINQALSAYLKTFSDNHANNSASGNLVITLIKDYLFESFEILTVSGWWQKDIILNSAPKNLIASYTSGIIHPPERF